MKLNLVPQAAGLAPEATRWLRTHFKKIAKLAGVTRGTITLMIVGDARMSELHGQYKDDPTTTDVLTFDLRQSPEDELEGDLVLCFDEAQRQSAKRGHDAERELLLYALHGLLHLIGYDDHRAADYRKMHAKEDELLEAAGLGAVFKKARRHVVTKGSNEKLSG